MKIKYVFFDLDGTLLPMDQNKFARAYFGALAKKLAVRGYDPEDVVKGLIKGTEAMMSNDGSMTNEQVFWRSFSSVLGENVYDEQDLLNDFYKNDFDSIRSTCGYDKRAAETVHCIRDMGCGTVLATNPLFPAVATEKRMLWAGVSKADFLLFTSYENSRFCKPSLSYYTDILKTLDVLPNDCVMVGNDVQEDMVAQELGMKVFLLDDNIIDRDGNGMDRYPHGSFDKFLDYMGEIDK